MTTRSLLGAAISVAALLIAGCTDADDAAPSTASASPTVTTTVASNTSPSPSTSTSTSSSTSTTTTTTVPGSATIAATCATLRTAPWPERRAVILVNTAAFVAEGGAGALVDPVRATCPDDLARQEAAAAQEQRMAATVDGLSSDAAENFIESACPETEVYTTYTNHQVEPLGLMVGARALAPGNDGDIGPVDAGAVVWSLAPAQALLLTMPLSARAMESCGWLTKFFLAETAPVDAAIPNGPGPATTGDDPALWLPTLVQARLAAAAAATEAAWNDVEDARLLRRIGVVPEPATDVHPLVSATVCPGTIDQPDADHIAFASRTELAPRTVDGEEHPGFATLSYGAFRRGSDGRWRMLVSPLELNGSLMGADCGPIVPHP